ncbi:MAG: endolytic transglycosylase MltG [Deltaproteobacteria bacterium]|nr:endolytic transglycosylase MltG [Deltaproteobacteria bacterium]
MRRTLLLALVFAGLAGVVAVTLRLLTAPLPPPGAMLVVREGDTFATVAARLERAGVIRSAILFRLRARVAGRDRHLQPGEYRFAEPLDTHELLELLASGGPHREVTIPEGFTVRDVAALLERDGYGSGESFLCVAKDPEFLLAAGVPGPQLEGFLFPDTYRLTPLMSPSEILALMVRRFHDRFDAERYRRAAARGMTVNEVLTLASIVEKESALATERQVIAGVFYNRLHLGMPLQSDPTVIYAIPNFNGDLTRADLVRPSAYNTYMVAGLPPGPIANPGLAAIDAVLAPAETPYLYFVSKNDGSHVFAATLPEHNRNVGRYQKAHR